LVFVRMASSGRLAALTGGLVGASGGASSKWLLRTGDHPMTVTAAKKRTTLTRRMAREPQAAIIPDAARVIVEQVIPAKRQTKAALVSELLLAEGGASLEQLCQATGWQAHTCRAFLTGLRKKDQPLVRSKREDGMSVYQLQPASEASAVLHLTAADEAQA
jgi:hypothetical protein